MESVKLTAHRNSVVNAHIDDPGTHRNCMAADVRARTKSRFAVAALTDEFVSTIRKTNRKVELNRSPAVILLLEFYSLEERVIFQEVENLHTIQRITEDVLQKIDGWRQVITNVVHP